MTILPLFQDADTTDAVTSVPTLVYDAPDAPPVGAERFLLQQDKLYVVLAVVLIIWLGIAFYLVRTDRRLARLERDAERAAPTRVRSL